MPIIDATTESNDNVRFNSYKRKPQFTKAAQVTNENMWDLAQQIDGNLVLDEINNEKKYGIQLGGMVLAYVGDWIMEMSSDLGSYFTTCPNQSFTDMFESVTVE